MAKIVKALLAFKPFITNPVVRFLIGVPLLIGVQLLGEHYQKIGFQFIEKTLGTLTLVIAYYFIFLPVITSGTLGRVYSFHETQNTANLHKNPLKFAFKHKSKIITLYKSLFIILAIFATVMMWFFD